MFGTVIATHNESGSEGIVKVFKLCFTDRMFIGSSVGAHAVAWLFALGVSTNSFSSLVILFSSQILKGSGHGVQHLESLGFGLWASSGTLNTRKHNVSGEGETETQLDSFSETLFLSI
jgi:hypothetical protein